MAAEPGVFEAFYHTPLQHPWLLWAAALAALWVVRRRDGLHGSLRRYATGLVVLSLADAWLTSSWVPGLGTLPAAVAGIVPLGFVLAGDFRFLLVAVGVRPEGILAPGAREIGAALGLTAIVPLLSQLVLAALPAAWEGPRTLYLVYELAFLALATALRAGHPRVRGVPWLRSLCAFVMLYYGLWALADVVILAGWDAGYALRVVPNVLYYGGLIAAIARLAPAYRDAQAT